MAARTTVSSAAATTPSPAPSADLAAGCPQAEDLALSLVDGIDPGYALTKKGRAKRNRSKRDEHDPNDITRHRFAAGHIKRAFSLFSYIPTMINHGIKRRAREEVGDSIDGIMTDRDYTAFKETVAHLTGFEGDIVRYRDDPMTFRALVRQIQEGADAARSNDVCNIKKDIGLMLEESGIPAIKAIKHGDTACTKTDRGFHHHITGRYLCPVIYDWDDIDVQEKLRDGNYSVTADLFPRLLYADCHFNPDDLEEGLGRNKALVRVVKYIFTGRSSAFSDTAGGKTTRAGNAELAGMHSMTPKAIAYGACVMRFALSPTASWCKMDMEFDMEKFYWSVVDIFQEDDHFSHDLLAWWNFQVFGTGIHVQEQPKTQSKTVSSLSALRNQRAAKKVCLLQSLDVHSVQQPLRPQPAHLNPNANNHGGPENNDEISKQHPVPPANM